ncbi:nicotinate-nucleotide adenylyltransferase [Thiohalomonas denitrificans]|uniref:Probable nicotinate-nucleotide adenylyltransferase n=1 Tax=Thiohalomonas denitrificans TaxID=415747 RepID=A0A1G5PMT4_9GAMM|nr:nicotinate-nucleotide adenylyltransferase [Thiohalomonas denitrificans]SCZ50792.1 nicotinate-nucleotide adenylyltransferase [Thiohalomonas denitrificans]
MRSIGVFGGTFDPIHFGHLRAALELYEGLQFDEVRLVPASIPPHRDEPSVDSGQRLAMVEAAISEQPDFVIDERELRREGPSYMVDTLQSMRDDFGDISLSLLMGLDAFLGLPRWHRWERILELAHIVVAHRPGWHLDEAEEAEQRAVELLEERRAEATILQERPAGGIVLRAVTPLAISATAIRRLIGEGHSARYLIPDAVWHMIEKDQLYR